MKTDTHKNPGTSQPSIALRAASSLREDSGVGRELETGVNPFSWSSLLQQQGGVVAAPSVPCPPYEMISRRVYLRLCVRGQSGGKSGPHNLWGSVKTTAGTLSST